METQAEYKTGPAALFHVAATETRIWTYCPTCMMRTYQDYEKDREQFELYRCEDCRQLHGIAVR